MKGLSIGSVRIFKPSSRSAKRTETSEAQVSSFNANELHAAFCVEKFMAETMEESGLESELE